jgi:OOP family OmpA-OmpF porin
MLRVAFVLAAITSISPAPIPPFPDYFSLPAAMSIPDANRTIEEQYGEGLMPFGGNDNLKRGRHVASRFAFAGVEFSDDQKWRPRVWDPIRQSLSAAGWVVKEYQDTNPPMATLQYARNGLEAWLRMQLFAPDQIEIDFIEVKPFTPTLTFPSPAAKPETIAEDAPFPFLPPLAGARRGSVDPGNGAIYVTFKGDEQPTMVTTASVRKNYHDLQAISNLQFILEYRSALNKAGWQIVNESQGLNQSDAVLTAHYAQNGRDIWAYLHFGGDLSITVGETGDLAAALKANCHVPVYGITFDFNKTTLRPDSEGSLQRIVTLLQGDAPLAIEVQGHTDNVGGDDYNLKLSQGRADAVKTWLVAHAIAADRITTRGYGRQQPIADNDSDEGRAKNRRVEIARAGCK